MADAVDPDARARFFGGPGSEWLSTRSSSPRNGRKLRLPASSRAQPIDRADGFIHFSTAEQAAETAAKWFAGRRDLTLAAIDADALGEDMRWEPSRGGALFPHLYAALPMSAVVWSRPLPLGPDGAHVFGSLEA